MVVGARQTGKTYIIDKFCKEYFKSYIYINLELDDGLQKVFNNTLNPEEVIKYIEVTKECSIDADNTAIFIDEVQVSERAITSLKYFCEAERNYKIITAGSLLGVKLNRFKSSFPVGKVKFEYLYPMNFEEFILAKGKKKLLEEIKKSLKDINSLPEAIHDLAMNEYREYLCIGGMPKAVLNYIDNGCDINKFDGSIHQDIISAYLADMRRYTYTAAETIKIQQVYEAMPQQLGRDNRKFKYNIMDKKATRKEFELPLDWLTSGNLLLKCSLVNKIQVPLRAFIQADYFKMYLSDVGLLNSLANIKYSDILYNSEFMFKGAITENYVACMLAQNKYDLLYWKSKSDAEIDFLITTDRGIIPIEVKSAENTKSKSLNEYIKKFQPEFAIRVSGKNFGKFNNIINIPLYAVGVEP